MEWENLIEKKNLKDEWWDFFDDDKIYLLNYKSGTFI